MYVYTYIYIYKHIYIYTYIYIYIYISLLRVEPSRLPPTPPPRPLLPGASHSVFGCRYLMDTIISITCVYRPSIRMHAYVSRGFDLQRVDSLNRRAMYTLSRP